MAEGNRLRIEVVFALPDRQMLRTLELPEGSTLREAIYASGLAREFPEIEIDDQRLGVFGRLRPPDHPLHDGDRVEVYRPLRIDPREARRKRAGKES